MIIYLYIKQHSLTGLKYFGKTEKNPFKYLGSGKRWLRHIKKYGKQHVKTLEIWGFDNIDHCKNFALKFSKENNIVESKEWANLAPENGTDGGYRPNNYLIEYNKLKHPRKFYNRTPKGVISTLNAYTNEASMKKSETLKNYPILSCPHCGKTGKMFGRFKGSHFDKCKTRFLLPNNAP